MAISFPSLPKLSGRTVAVLAVVGAVAVGALAAGASRNEATTPSAGAPATRPQPKAPADQDQANQGQTDQNQTDQNQTDSTRTDAENKAAAALPQCGGARLVPVNGSWGIPLPSLSDNGNANCNLMYGDSPHRGSDRSGDPETAIQILQRNLNFCYDSKLAVDGLYGSKTRAMVKQVQRMHHLVADGIYGPKTRSAMNWRLYSSATNSWSKGCSSPL
jgi:hypothetical protein